MSQRETMVRFTFMLLPEEMEWLRERAKEDRSSAGTITRRAISEFMSRNMQNHPMHESGTNPDEQAA